MADQAPVNQSTTLSQKVSDGLSSIKDSIKKVQLPLKKGALSGGVVVMKLGLSKLAFQCPEKNYRVYSMLFIIAPAVLLLCLALMLSKPFWHLTVGSCFLPRRFRQSIWRRYRRSLYLCLFAPIFWLLFVYVQADYYVCYKLGAVEQRYNETSNPLEKSMILLEIESIETESHMITIVMVVVVALLATIGITLDRCCTKVDKTITDEEEYAFYLAEEQIKLFNAKLEPLAKQQAKQEVEELFEKYKDVSSDPAEKIRLISKEIEKKVPWMAVGTV